MQDTSNQQHIRFRANTKSCKTLYLLPLNLRKYINSQSDLNGFGIIVELGFLFDPMIQGQIQQDKKQKEACNHCALNRIFYQKRDYH